MIRSAVDHRLRLVYVPEHEVLDWFAAAASHWRRGKCLSLPMISGLPEDVTVLGVHHRFENRAFAFTIHSATFSEALEGAEIPVWEGCKCVRYESVELRTDEDRRRETMANDVEMATWPEGRVWRHASPINQEDKAALLKAIQEQTERTSVLLPSPIGIGFQGHPGATGGPGYDPGPSELWGGHSKKAARKAMEKMESLAGKTLVVNDGPEGVEPSEADAMFKFFKGE